MNYLKEMVDLITAIEGTAKLHHVLVYHDDWCAFFKGGDCDCIPEVVKAKDITLGQVEVCKN